MGPCTAWSKWTRISLFSSQKVKRVTEWVSCPLSLSLSDRVREVLHSPKVQSEHHFNGTRPAGPGPSGLMPAVAPARRHLAPELCPLRLLKCTQVSFGSSQNVCSCCVNMSWQPLLTWFMTFCLSWATCSRSMFAVDASSEFLGL